MARTTKAQAHAEITKLVMKHMAMLEEGLRLERKYPDWSEEGVKEFERLQHRQSFVATGIANLLAEQMHASRWDWLCTEQERDGEARMAEQAILLRDEQVAAIEGMRA